MSSVTTIPRGWDATDIPDLTGKHFVITGGTSGIGKEAARELARAGAHVTITARNAAAGAASSFFSFAASIATTAASARASSLS